MSLQLTDQQIGEWRKALVSRFGDRAFTMSVDEIQTIMEGAQDGIDKRELLESLKDLVALAQGVKPYIEGNNWLLGEWSLSVTKARNVIFKVEEE